MTISDAIRQVMKEAGKPLTAKEAYDLIKAKNLYPFKAQNPQSIVAGTIRKHCKGIQRQNGGKDYFEEVSKGKYKLI